MEMLIGCIRGRSITPPVWVITLPTRTSIQALTRFTLPVRNFPMNLFIECCQSAEAFPFDVGVHRYPSLAHNNFNSTGNTDRQ